MQKDEKNPSPSRFKLSARGKPDAPYAGLSVTCLPAKKRRNKNVALRRTSWWPKAMPSRLKRCPAVRPLIKKAQRNPNFARAGES